MKTLKITDKAHQKLRGYIDNCSEEISGMGKIEVVDGGFVLLDVVILKQTVTSGHTDIDDDALGKFCHEMTVKEGGDIEKWALWWHSHAKISAFFSTTDESTIQDSTEMPFLVSLVGNHAGEWEARLDVFKPHPTTADLKVVPEFISNSEIKIQCTKEIEKLVTPEIVMGYGQGNYGRRVYQQPQANLPKWHGDYNRELNDKTIEDYNMIPYTNPYLEELTTQYPKCKLTAREVGLLHKANNGALTDEESIEITHLIDLLDNTNWSLLDTEQLQPSLGL